MKKKALLSSILTIALCLSLIVGSTFALFTSESKTNVAVTSGKVDVTATASTPVISSLLEGGVLPESTATLDGNTVKLDKIVAGDKVEFNITVHNASDVTVKYRTVIGMVDDNGLWNALVVTIGGDTYNGATKVTAWETIAPSSKDVVIPVSVVLPVSATSEVSGKTCTFAYTVEAVQGNAETTDPDANVIYVYTKQDLKALSGSIISTAKTIEFVNDVDMTGTDMQTVYFKNCDVKVNGNGHTVTGLCAPLFNFFGGNVEVKDLTVANSTINANTGDVGGAAAIIEQAQWVNLTVTNCKVDNVTVNGSDKRVGAILGTLYGGADITGCTVNNCRVNAKGSVAGIVGHEQRQTPYNDYLKITNCTVTASTFTATDETWRVGTVIGTVAGNNTYINNTTSTGNTLVMNDINNEGQTLANPGHEMFGRIAGGSIEIDGNVYCTAAQASAVLMAYTTENGVNTVTFTKNYVIIDDWTPLYYGYGFNNITIDGAGHSISGLNASFLRDTAAQNITIKNLTIKDSNITNGNENGLGRGAFIAFADDSTYSVTVKDCTLENSTVVSTEGAGAVVGYAGANVKVDIDGFKVLGNTSITGDKAGGIIGTVYANANGVEFKNCTVANTVVITSTRSTPVKGSIIGRAIAPSGGTITVSGCTFSGEAVGENYNNQVTIVID